MLTKINCALWHAQRTRAVPILRKSQCLNKHAIIKHIYVYVYVYICIEIKYHLYINIYSFFSSTFLYRSYSNFTFMYTFILLRQAICKLTNYREVKICMFNIFLNKQFKKSIQYM